MTWNKYIVWGMAWAGVGVGIFMHGILLNLLGVNDLHIHTKNLFLVVFVLGSCFGAFWWGIHDSTELI